MEKAWRDEPTMGLLTPEGFTGRKVQVSSWCRHTCRLSRLHPGSSAPVMKENIDFLVSADLDRLLHFLSEYP